MERRTVARALRALRRRRRWTQRRLALSLGISQAELSRRERSALEWCTAADVERWAAALGAHAALELRIDGQRPLTDARHAALQEWLVRTLREAAWVVEAEVSFNHYGDRGRVDLLAWDPRTGSLLAAEIKTRLDDVHDVLGRLDVKRRIAPQLAAERGWRTTSTVPMLAFVEATTTRRRIAAHQALFARYTSRGRPAAGWLRRPAAPAPTGILLLVRLPG